MLLQLASLCGELSRIQVQLLQRQGAPVLLAHEAIQLLREQLPGLTENTSPVFERGSVKLVPKLLRSLATVLRFVPEEDSLAALDAVDTCAAMAQQYHEAGYVERTSSVNDACALLRSIASLEDAQARLTAVCDGPPRKSSSNLSSSPSNVNARSFDALLMPAYKHAMQLWTLPQEKPTALSVLSLVEASSRVHGKGFRFPAVSADKNGLLPAKAKVHMEAKMQRCIGARALLGSLRECEWNRIDAGMSLATMAQTGLYDAEVCNRSCETLYAQHALLSSQQLCQVLFHLGTLQHRHIHQKYFSSLIDARDCNAEAVRQHVLGLSMLRQPPPSEKALMNGVFLHALRASHAYRHSRLASEEASSSSESFRSSVSPTSVSPHSRRAIADPLNDAEDAYTLSPQWYIDVGHGLCCLNIDHLKFKLMTARQTRRSIGRLTTMERCKLLYALGGTPEAAVPADLRPSWRTKVDSAIAITAEKLNDIEPHDGPYVMHALLHCGIHRHRRIPRAPQLQSCENPLEVLLRTWSTVPKEKVLELTEQIKPQHLRTNELKNTCSTLSNVAARVAASFTDVVPRSESHRLEPLCAALDAHSADMTVEDTMRTLQALQRLGRTGPRQQEVARNLLTNLWTRRYDLQTEQLTQCCACVQHWPEVPEAMQLLQFAASHYAA